MDFTVAVPTAGIPHHETTEFVRDFIKAVLGYFLVFEDSATPEKVKAAVDNVISTLLMGTGVSLQNLNPQDPGDEVLPTDRVAQMIVENETMLDDSWRVGGAGFLDTSDYNRGDWGATMEGLTHEAGLGNPIQAQALQDLFIRSLASGSWPVLNPYGDGDFADKLKRILDLSDPLEMKHFVDFVTHSTFIAGMRTFLRQRVPVKGFPLAGDVFLMWGLPGHTKAGAAYTLREGVPSVTVAEKIREFLAPPVAWRPKSKKRRTGR
jgi:hypothetical protein